MNTQDIDNALDPDLQTSLTAMRRAARLARETAIRGLLLFGMGN